MISNTVGFHFNRESHFGETLSNTRRKKISPPQISHNFEDSNMVSPVGFRFDKKSCKTFSVTRPSLSDVQMQEFSPPEILHNLEDSKTVGTHPEIQNCHKSVKQIFDELVSNVQRARQVILSTGNFAQFEGLCWTAQESNTGQANEM